MKLIELNQKLAEMDSIQKVAEQVRQLLSFGKTGEHAEDAVVARFLRGLDNRFIMVRKLHPGSSSVPFPPILVGPAGLAILNISRERGFFKVKDDSWWKMDKTTHRFRPARPNLIKQSQGYATSLTMLLDAHGKSHPEVTPVLIFANPGVHIETTNPAIRIVLMDGVENLINTMLNSEEVLQLNEINSLSDSFEVMANPEKAIPMGEGEDFFGRDLFVPEKKAPPKMPDIPIPTEMPLPDVNKKLKISKMQWVILAGLMILTIVVLLGAILYALIVV